MAIHYVGGGCFAFSDITDGSRSVMYDDDSYMYKKSRPKTQEEIEHERKEQLKMEKIKKLKEKAMIYEACYRYTPNASIAEATYRTLLNHGLRSIADIRQLFPDTIFKMALSHERNRDEILTAIFRIRDYSPEWDNRERNDRIYEACLKGNKISEVANQYKMDKIEVYRIFYSLYDACMYNASNASSGTRMYNALIKAGKRRIEDLIHLNSSIDYIDGISSKSFEIIDKIKKQHQRND